MSETEEAQEGLGDFGGRQNPEFQESLLQWKEHQRQEEVTDAC